MMNRFFCFLLICICFVFFFCEYLIYYVVQMKCDWPVLTSKDETGAQLRALIISDTHLLGPYRGHWFDKLRREWQMSSAYQTAVSLHSPEIIFFLGDVFDEGKWANPEQYRDYVKRFHRLFPGTDRHHIVVGNHDVGFHYMMDDDKMDRFYQTFNTSSAELIRLKGIPFVSVNSMALEGDGCSICKDAEQRITKIAKKLNEAGDRPVLLQHFPLHRKSDELCRDEVDSAPDDEKRIPFRPKFDCLSEISSNWLMDVLQPRVAFSGHTHHSCVYSHGNHRLIEYSVPSFSWRYRNDPSYLLIVFSDDNQAIYKCRMPQETTVIRIYSISLFSVMAMCLYRRYITGRHVKTL